MILDLEDKRPPKKQRQPVTATKIWVRDSHGRFEVYSDCALKELKDKLSDYTFLQHVAEMSGYQPQSFDTIECHLADTVPQRQFTFQYDGHRSAKRWMSTIDSLYLQTVHTYAKLQMRLQHFEVRVMAVPERVPLDVPLILDSSMSNDKL